MKENWIDAISLKIRPDLNEKVGIEQAWMLLDMSTLVGALSTAMIAVIWLVLVTDSRIIRQDWTLFVLLLVLMALFSHFTFELRLQITKTVFSSASGSLMFMVLWSGMLIFGPTALWLQIVLTTGQTIWQWINESNRDYRWVLIRSYVQNISLVTLSGLIGLSVYAWIGGIYPLTELAFSSIWKAFVAMLVTIVIQLLLVVPFARRMVRVMDAFQEKTASNSTPIVQFLFVAMNSSNIILPFGILAAGLYTEFGLGIYLFFVSFAFLASLLANRLSQAVDRSEQRSRELKNLESLAQAILNAPPEQMELPQLLEQHVEGMFQQAHMHIWLYPDSTLFKTKLVETVPQLAEAQALAKQESAAYYQLFGVRLPEETGGRYARSGLIVPIVDESNKLQGGIYLLKRTDLGAVMDYLPAAHSLAGQVAAALRRAEVHKQTVASAKMARELEVAGQIQASFLPSGLPNIAGWEIVAAIEPALQTSGDFYDFVELDNGRIGLVVADVADKGTGAALYMALSRTLIRTYALQYPDHPEEALRLANERILQDTQSDQFVTVFYGILDTNTGTLTYTNAGHNPALLLSKDGQTAPQWLGQTGIPLGMFEDMAWRQNVVPIKRGDVLVMYSDGITEAQDVDAQEFGEERLLAVMEGGNGRSAQAQQNNILRAIHEFVGEAPQFDDITLMVVQNR
ncbi:Serine phosphatase RsbU, regulator of sigma subunit [hydrothermal vent metagenome]|uniref:Serine phosphatase RsbU, regulator of sigma subunit n=1 Tax=hydrothermal vent metagenome TaxID=652676 RepID=A0A3B0W1A4_9ZZZZ